MSESEGGAKKEVKTRFPAARIKRLMQSDEDIGKVAQATPVVVGKALELFMISLIEESCKQARERNSKRVLPSHLKQAVHTVEHFDILHDVMAKYPDPVAEEVDDNGEKKRKRKPKAAPV